MCLKTRLLSIFLFGLLVINLPQIKSQDSLLRIPVSIKLKNTKLLQALTKLEEQVGCYFTYEGSIINPQKKISQNFNSTPLYICLNKILEDTSLMYQVVDNHVIITKKRFFTLQKERIDSMPKYIVIKGKIVDKQGDLPLPYCSININGYSLGVVSNLQGEFILKLSPQMISEQICISFMGYKNLFLPVKNYIDTFSIFKLERSFITIQEVIIRKKDPKAIISAALGKIDQNYSIKPFYFTGFYRESVKRNNEFMFFSEAVVNVYKASYRNLFEGDMIKVLKSRKMQNIKQEDTVALKLKSGLGNCLELDFIKNKIDFLNVENFELYNYVMADIVTFNDRSAYLIEFEPKKDKDDAYFEGKVYIDIEKLAIIGAEFAIIPQKVAKAQSNFIVKKNRGIKVKMEDINYTVNYRLINNTYYFNYVRGFLKMKVKKNGKLFGIDFETTLEMAVNEIDTINVERFKRSEVENPYTIFFDQVHEYDESFWENYNFIKPEEPIELSLQKLNKSK